MLCIPCMQCLICASLGDVWGTVFYHLLLFTTADLRIPLEALPEWYKPRVRSFIIILVNAVSLNKQIHP